MRAEDAWVKGGSSSSRRILLAVHKETKSKHVRVSRRIGDRFARVARSARFAPSVPPLMMIAGEWTVAGSCPCFRAARSSAAFTAEVAYPRVKSFTHPFPSVLPRTQRTRASGWRPTTPPEVRVPGVRSVHDGDDGLRRPRIIAGASTFRHLGCGERPRSAESVSRITFFRRETRAGARNCAPNFHDSR